MILLLVNGKSFGGAERIVCDISTNLKNEFDFICVSNSKKLGDLLHSEGILHILVSFKSIFNLWAFFKTYFILSNIIKRKEVKIVHSFHRIYLPLLILLKRNYDITSIYSAVNIFKDALMKFVRADYYTGLSTTIKEELLSLRNVDKSKVYLIPHGIKVREVNSNFEIIGKNKIVIGYAGRIVKEKGLDVLVNAIELISNKNLSVIIQGAGNQLQSIKRKINNAKLNHIFEFREWDDDLGKFFKSIDVFVLPSVAREGLGIVLLEALNANKLVIAADVGGIKYIIKDGYNGYLFPPNNFNALAVIIKNILNNELENNFMSNINHTLQNFKIENTLAEYKRLYYLVSGVNFHH